ncbi:MAG: hypothetical protein HY014_12625 [Acidobacteria bacterium]|nr:hypothetical protein [Acidobacteriota bacterium]MBI3488998.1 hypothetical protein [Acidobacteriota bacterium]
MYTVTSNPEQNRLYITLAGHMEGLERQAASKALIAEAAKLSPGFDVVTDISALHATNEEGFKDLLRVKATLKLKGVGHIIRVVRIPLSHLQFERITQQAGYESEYVNSVEEADRRLDELRAGS